jgi:hypothetical protein
MKYDEVSREYYLHAKDRKNQKDFKDSLFHLFTVLEEKSVAFSVFISGELFSSFSSVESAQKRARELLSYHGRKQINIKRVTL